MSAIVRTGSGRRRRVLPLSVALAAMLLLAACGGSTSAADNASAAAAEPEVKVPNPLPAGAEVPAQIEEESSGPADTSCDPTASFRPQGLLPQPGNMPPGSTMAEIVNRGRLIVGVDQSTYLFGYRNPDTGRLEGFDIDIAREMARALFGTTDALQFRVLSSAARIPAIQQGKVDMVVRTMTINCKRWEKVSFSTVYFEAGQRVLVRSDSDIRSIGELAGEKVCAAKGSTSIRNIANAGGMTPVGVNDWSDCLVMLQQGQVAAVSTDDTILAGLAAQDPHAIMVGPQITEEPYGIAMAKDATDLVRFVNGVLEQLREDGTWAALYTKWMGEAGAETPPPPEARYRD